MFEFSHLNGSTSALKRREREGIRKEKDDGRRERGGEGGEKEREREKGDREVTPWLYYKPKPKPNVQFGIGSKQKPKPNVQFGIGSKQDMASCTAHDTHLCHVNQNTYFSDFFDFGSPLPNERPTLRRLDHQPKRNRGKGVRRFRLTLLLFRRCHVLWRGGCEYVLCESVKGGLCVLTD